MTRKDLNYINDTINYLKFLRCKSNPSDTELATINNIIDELIITIYKLIEDNEYLEDRVFDLENEYL